MTKFIVPLNLVVKIKDITEDELENYITGIQIAINEILYSTDPEDDHYEVTVCEPEWNKVRKEVW